MPCKIDIDMSEVGGLLQQVAAGSKEKAIGEALGAEAGVLKTAIEKSSPRSTRPKKGKAAKRGHMQDHVRVSDVMVARTGSYYISVGPQLKPHDGYAYAALVNDGTSKQPAREFMEKALDAGADAAQDAAIDQLRKEMGLT